MHVGLECMQRLTKRVKYLEDKIIISATAIANPLYKEDLERLRNRVIQPVNDNAEFKFGLVCFIASCVFVSLTTVRVASSLNSYLSLIVFKSLHRQDLTSTEFLLQVFYCNATKK